VSQHVNGKGSCIIDTHTPELVEDVKFDHVFVLRAPINILHSRFEKRKYSKEKTSENISCEIMNVVWEECVEIFGFNSVTVFGEDSYLEIDDLVNEVLKVICGKASGFYKQRSA
jgi:adenylate kinase